VAILEMEVVKFYLCKFSDISLYTILAYYSNTAEYSPSGISHPVDIAVLAVSSLRRIRTSASLLSTTFFMSLDKESSCEEEVLNQ